mmetsp:Transcript_711/g.1480  ORF Transcript_711/g.1480 Transcript_711/m.1480 type:complete len:210 (+) Transcript_711:810-1439(+)
MSQRGGLARLLATLHFLLLQHSKLPLEAIHSTRKDEVGGVGAALEVVLLDLGVVLQNLFVYKMADVLLGQLALLKVELQLANGLGLRLVCRRAQAVEYGGGQALGCGGTIRRVKLEHQLQQIHDALVGVHERAGQRHPRLVLHVGKEAPRLLVSHLGELLRSGRAQHVGDQLQLVHHVAPGEQRLARNDLGEDAAEAPDVHARGVLGEE